MTNAIISKKALESQEVETELNKPIILTRVETNFEKLPIWSPKPKRGTVFVPSKTVYLEPEKLADGTLVERKIEIIPSAKYGYPTVQTEEYWYALQKLWHDTPSPMKETGRIEFSRRQIIENVLGKTYGRQTRRALDLSLNQLGTTRFTFNYVFYDKANDITHKEIKKFHLIVEENLTERKRKDEIIHDKCSVTLHPLVVSNLRSGYFKPIILSVVSQLKSDTARLLYRKLDTQFSYYSRYEISTERFFREHGLKGSEYKYPSARKRLLEKGIKELINKRTSSGALIRSYEIVKTKNQKDYKLIVHSASPKEYTNISDVTFKNKQANSIIPAPKIKQKPKQNLSESVQLFTYFDHIFLADSGREPSKKELEQINKIVKEHGLHKSKTFIDYVYKKYLISSYKPKIFTEILQDIDEAIKQSNYEERKKQGITYSNYRVNVEEYRKKEEKFDYITKHEKKYHLHILRLKEIFTQQNLPEIAEFENWEIEKRKELEKELANAPSKMVWISEKKLKMFDEHKGAQALRFIEYFAGHDKIKLPDFWEWDKKHNVGDD